MKKIIFHPQAEAEFDNAIDFYEEKQPGLGLDLEQEDDMIFYDKF